MNQTRNHKSFNAKLLCKTDEQESTVYTVGGRNIECKYSLPLPLTVKTISRGAVDDRMHYWPRPSGLGRWSTWSSTEPRAIELTLGRKGMKWLFYYLTNVRVCLIYVRKLSIYFCCHLARERADSQKYRPVL